MKNIIVELNAKNPQELTIVLDELNKSNLIKLDREYKPIKIKKRKKDRKILTHTLSEGYPLKKIL